MKYLKQTRFHIPGKQNGNCFPTVIACLLDLEIADVPNIDVLFDIAKDVSGDEHLWLRVIVSWLNSKGYDWHSVNQESIAPGEFYLVVGNSSRGVKHVCIYRDGKMIWDPHPSNEGLITEDHYEIITKIQEQQP